MYRSLDAGAGKWPQEIQFIILYSHDLHLSFIMFMIFDDLVYPVYAALKKEFIFDQRSLYLAH